MTALGRRPFLRSLAAAWERAAGDQREPLRGCDHLLQLPRPRPAVVARGGGVRLRPALGPGFAAPPALVPAADVATGYVNTLAGDLRATYRPVLGPDKSVPPPVLAGLSAALRTLAPEYTA